MTSKRITSAKDLAINGAPPAFDEPLHVGRPNIGDRAEFMRQVDAILERGWLTNNGPVVQELERRLAEFLGVRHCIAMCNGTVALEIAIRALGLEGEVIVPSWTFIATAHALQWQGITPVFADIDPATHNLDPESVRRAITPRTSGIIGVHLWGRPAPVDELQSIAGEHGLKLMFDAAHAFGSSYQGKRVGVFGACEVFSFHATKSFNTLEGGSVCTNDDGLAETMRLMRNFGFAGYDDVTHLGVNGKMTEISAAMGLTNLAEFDAIVASNRANHAAYLEALEHVPGLSLRCYGEEENNSHHYIVMEVDESCPVNRDRIVAGLHAENVLARKYFWPGCHRMKPYRDLRGRPEPPLPHTEAIAEKVVVLPNGRSTNRAMIHTVADIVRMLVSTQS